MKPITDTTLVSVMAATDKPMVIKFEAKWCAPCKAMTPVLVDIEKQYGDRVDFFTANVEHCQLISQRYGVTQIPAVIVLDGGIVTGKRIGAGSRQEITEWMVRTVPSLRNER